jgi:hypothetical protein
MDFCEMRADRMQKELTMRLDEPMEKSVADVVLQVEKVQEIMKRVMRKGIHYGAPIPGSDRLALLKPGSEKLLLCFRLNPSFDIRRTDLERGHREYEIVCTLRHQPTGMELGQGVGCASTMETKYRFRWESTNRLVPGEYWKSRDAELLGGAGFVPRKLADKWWIVRRVEHDNPADYFNTCLKIGKKRSLVDAVLSTTAASDIFGPELEGEEDAEQRSGTDSREPGEEG